MSFRWETRERFCFDRAPTMMNAPHDWQENDPTALYYLVHARPTPPTPLTIGSRIGGLSAIFTSDTHLPVKGERSLMKPATTAPPETPRFFLLAFTRAAAARKRAGRRS
jgi:hypothetical protein